MADKLLKKCMSCDGIRLKNYFKYSHIKTHSPYCVFCYINKEYFSMINQFEIQLIQAEKYIEKYGKSWLQKVNEYDFNLDYFMKFDEDNFDFCIYCGNKFPIDDAGHIKYHIDHMNPKSFGGETSYKNCIHVCHNCNSSKGNILFSEWLNHLKPENRKLSEEIYIRKHGYKPEQFVPPPEVDVTLNIQVNSDFIICIESYPKITGEINSIYSDINYLKSIKEREIVKLKNKLIFEVGNELFNEAIRLYKSDAKYLKKLKKYTELRSLESYY